MPERFNVCLYFLEPLSIEWRLALLEALPGAGATRPEGPRAILIQDLPHGTQREADWAKTRDELAHLLTPDRILTVYYELPNAGRLAVNVEVSSSSECHTLSFPDAGCLGRGPTGLEHGLRSLRDWAERAAGKCLLFAGPELELDLGSDGSPARVVPRALSSDLLAFAIIRDPDRPLLPGEAAISWAERGMLGIRIH